MSKLIFKNINKIIFFGGGKFLLWAAKEAHEKGYQVVVFSSKRHLCEDIGGASFLDEVKKAGFVYHCSDNINNDDEVIKHISDKTLGISMGAAWIFKKHFIERFKGRLLNLHGTRLPQGRGGGGFTWQILCRNRLGFCLVHQVDDGVDTGNVITYKEFIYPLACIISQDYIDYHCSQNMIFFSQFLESVKKESFFTTAAQPEYLSSYWPRLNTLNQAFIDWSWSLEEIVAFINAFDSPYCGASTFVGGKRVFLKCCCADYNDGSFHPFQKGIVYKIGQEALFVSTKEGSLIVRQVLNEEGRNVINEILLGDRLATRGSFLESAKEFRAVYTPDGLK